MDEMIPAKRAARTKLGKAEEQFLLRFVQCYVQHRTTRHLMVWDLRSLGLPVDGGGWDYLDLGAKQAVSLMEYWELLSAAFKKQGYSFPKYVQTLAVSPGFETYLALANRRHSVEIWIRKFSEKSMGAESQLTVAEDTLQPEMRLAFQAKAAAIEVREPSGDAYLPLKRNRLRQLMEADRLGQLNLDHLSEMLWCYVREVVEVGSRINLPYDDERTNLALGRVLKSLPLAERVVGADGQPFERCSTPLSWQLQLLPDAAGDYQVCLRSGERTVGPSELIQVFDGNPGIYLTQTAVFRGPPPGQDQFGLTEMPSVPAEAIESIDGIRALVNLGIELPAHLAAKVRRIPMRVAIHCRLSSAYPNGPEDCEFRVEAFSETGVKETWDGYLWRKQPSVRPRFVPTLEAPDAEPDVVTVFDRSAMARIPSLLAPLSPKHCGYRNQLVIRVTRKFPQEFSSWLASVPADIDVTLEGDLLSFRESPVEARVRLEASEQEIDWFDLRVCVDTDDTDLSAEELKLLLEARAAFVRIKGKGWRRLKFNLSEEEDEQLARLGLSPHELSAEPQRLHALQLADVAAKRFLPERQVEQIQMRASELKTRVTPPIPSGVNASLRPYQLDGFHFLCYLSSNRFGGILADDMGLGKTLQTLTWLCWLREQPADPRDSGPPPPSRPSLVVAPKSVTDNWRAEAEKFSPSIKVRVWTAAEIAELPKQTELACLHVINYTQLRNLAAELGNVSWLAVILDEGQYIKNPDSQAAQAARALRCQHRLILSGTPIENKLLDLWSLMSFAMPGILGNRQQFAKIYNSKEDMLARRRLASRLRPFLIRRTKSQVARDLPDRIEEDLYCEIEGEQKTLYQAELKHARQMLLKVQTGQDFHEFQFHFLASLMRLRQICCHPILAHPDSTGPSAKVEALFEQIEPIIAEGHKVLVFSQFLQLIEVLEKEMTAREWRSFKLTGSTENRGQLIEEFQQAPGAAVFLLSLKAGGFGLNLTAANYVVLFDPWWNPAVENQAIDRTHRIGQTQTVIAYRLLIKNSIEEKIRHLQRQKSDLAQDILGEEKFARSLTLNDMQFLLA